MNEALKHLQDEVLKLTHRERSELAEFLISLHGEPEDTPEAIAKAWDEEIARRVTDMEAGRTKWVSAEEMMARLDDILQKARDKQR